MSDAIEAGWTALLANTVRSATFSRKAFEAAITAYEAAKGGGVEVKPLEWHECAKPFIEKAEAYLIGRDAARRYWFHSVLFGDIRGRLAYFDTFKAAMAAAQADYESRIRARSIAANIRAMLAKGEPHDQ